MPTQDHVPGRAASHPLAADPELEGSLRRANDDDRALAEVAERLRDELLLLPLRGAMAPEHPPERVDAQTPGTWPALIGERDEPLLPAFTSADRLRDWRPGARFLALPLDVTLRLASLLEVDGVVIDPETDHAMALLPSAATGSDDGSPTPDVEPGRDEGHPPPFFASNHPLRALAAPLLPDDLAAIDRVVAQDPELAAVAGIWAVELHAPDRTVRLVLAVDGTWRDDGSATVSSLASRLHGNLLAPGYLDVDVLALTDAGLREEVAALDDPIHPRGAR